MPAWLLAGYLAAMTGDAVSTHVALAHGARETILFQSPVKNDLVLGAEAAAVVTASTQLAKHHPKLAKGLLLASTAIRVGVVAQNVRVIREQERHR